MEMEYVEQFIMSTSDAGQNINLPLGREITVESNSEIALPAASFIYERGVDLTEDDYIVVTDGSVDEDDVLLPFKVPLGTTAGTAYTSLVDDLTNTLNVNSLFLLGLEWKAFFDRDERLNIAFARSIGTFPQFYLNNANVDVEARKLVVDIPDVNGIYTGEAITFGHLCRGLSSVSFTPPNVQDAAIMGINITNVNTNLIDFHLYRLPTEYRVEMRGVEVPIVLETAPSVDDTIQISIRSDSVTVEIIDKTTQGGLGKVRYPVDMTGAHNVSMYIQNSTDPLEISDILWTMSPFITSTVDGYSIAQGEIDPTLDNVTGAIERSPISISFDTIAAANKLGFSSTAKRELLRLSGVFIADYPIGHYNTPAAINLGLRTSQLQLNSKDNLIVSVPVMSVSSDRVSFQSQVTQWLQFRMATPWRIKDLELFAEDDQGKPITLKNLSVTLLIKTPVNPGLQGPLTTQSAKLSRLGGVIPTNTQQVQDSALIKAIENLSVTIPRAIQDALRSEQDVPKREVSKRKDNNMATILPYPPPSKPSTLLPTRHSRPSSGMLLKPPPPPPPSTPVPSTRPSSYDSNWSSGRL